VEGVRPFINDQEKIMNMKRSATALLALTLVAAACGSDDTSEPVTTDAPAAIEAPEPSAPAVTESAAPVTGPATITADDQSGDGSTVTVAWVNLPTDGYVVIHAGVDGSPGPILGWSDLLPAGDSSDVMVTLNEPLTASATVYPMAHVDANGNGEYEFMPPDVTIDVPATTEGGAVAALPISYDVTVDADGGVDGEGAAASGARLELATSDLGDHLVDSEGNTLYVFMIDTPGESACYDDCEETWPIVDEVTSVGEGLDESLVGTTNRTTGDVQATYNGWPLYYFAGDAGPGDVNGQGIGDVWYVLDATGEPIGL